MNIIQILSRRDLLESVLIPIGHWEEHRGGMSIETIEQEPSYLEAIPILSPSMSILDVSSEHIYKPILDLDDSLYALFLEPHDDPRNPLRQPKHRNLEGHKENQEEQQQWLEDIKNLCVVAIEWMDEVLVME